MYKYIYIEIREIDILFHQETLKQLTKTNTNGYSKGEWRNRVKRTRAEAGVFKVYFVLKVLTLKPHTIIICMFYIINKRQKVFTNYMQTEKKKP